MNTIVVKATWDDEAKVWFATSSDIDGLAIESATMEELQEKLEGALCDLLELNGFGSDLPEIPVHLLSSQVQKLRNPCH